MTIKDTTVNCRMNQQQKKYIETEAQRQGVTNSHLLLMCFKKLYPQFPFDTRKETERVRKYKQARK